jgi:hypothetical protein
MSSKDNLHNVAGWVGACPYGFMLVNNGGLHTTILHQQGLTLLRAARADAPRNKCVALLVFTPHLLKIATKAFSVGWMTESRDLDTLSSIVHTRGGSTNDVMQLHHTTILDLEYTPRNSYDQVCCNAADSNAFQPCAACIDVLHSMHTDAYTSCYQVIQEMIVHALRKEVKHVSPAGALCNS